MPEAPRSSLGLCGSPNLPVTWRCCEALLTHFNGESNGMTLLNLPVLIRCIDINTLVDFVHGNAFTHTWGLSAAHT